MRQTGQHSKQSIVFISSDFKTEFYHVYDNRAEAIDFLTAVDYLKAPKDELPVLASEDDSTHYAHVNKALSEYKNTFIETTDIVEHATRRDLDRTSLQALRFLREVTQVCNDDLSLKNTCTTLKNYIEDGVYAQLPRRIRDISNEYKHDRPAIKQAQYQLQSRLEDLANEYKTQDSTAVQQQRALENPNIVISETFI